MTQPRVPFRRRNLTKHILVFGRVGCNVLCVRSRIRLLSNLMFSLINHGAMYSGLKLHKLNKNMAMR